MNEELFDVLVQEVIDDWIDDRLTLAEMQEAFTYLLEQVEAS